MFTRALTIAAATCKPTFIARSRMIAVRPLQMQAFRGFSTQKLNENEIIEYVEGKVFEVLKSAAKCKHEKLARTAHFEELGFDSLDGVELVLAMEEYFGFDISNNEAEKITSVMDAIQVFHGYVVKR
jgi:acyl carrier protein